MENLEVRLKCVELLIEAYINNKSQYVSIEDIIYQADRLANFIIGIDFEESECVGTGILDQRINIESKVQIDLAIERLERLMNSVSSNHLRKELMSIYTDLVSNLTYRKN